MVADATAPRSAPRVAMRAGTRLARVTTPFAIVFVAALFAICHPYNGIRGDSSIYMMRVLADLDPTRLGRDLMVVDDGQMRFSLFPLLVRPLVAWLGAAQAAVVVAAFGSAVWLGALALLARGLAAGHENGRLAWAMVAMVAVLPVSYGDLNLFAFAETAATPRPLAEAAVLAALAAILAARPLLAAAALGLALMIHPLMALAGLGVAAVLLVWRLPPRIRTRTLVAVAIAASLAVVLGLLGVPILDRLATRMDPWWFGLIAERSPHLLPSHWTSAAFAPLVAQAATIVVAAHRAPNPQRRLYLAALGVGALGLAGAVLLADALHVVLVVQLQTWRATWLIGVLGGCALASCVATLWRAGNLPRIVLALMALAWFVQPGLAVTVTIAAFALMIEFGGIGRGWRIERRHVVVAYVLSVAATLFWVSGPLLGYAAYLGELPPGDTPSLIDPLRNNLHTLPLWFVIAGWLVMPLPAIERRFGPVALAIGGLGLVAANAWGWDQRGPARMMLETPQAPPGLAALAAGRNPAVLWLGTESDAWFALERPQYFSIQQGVSIVFSRPLAVEWTRRADLLIGLGLEPRGVYRPWQRLADDDRPRVTRPAIDALCARPDAPGLVLFPLRPDQPAPRDMITWSMPAPLFKVERYASDEIRRVDAIGVVPCGQAETGNLDSNPPR